MDAFLHNIFSFPTAVFTVFLSIMLIYWLFAIIGLADLDLLDLGVDLDTDANLEGLAGLMVTLGLSGVPATVVLVILGVIAWLTSYFTVHFLFFWDNTWLNLLAGIPVILFSAAVAVFITARIVKPLKSIFKKAYAQVPEKVLIGRKCKVRSAHVDANHGEALVNLDGADLIIKVRSLPAEKFSRGDIVTISEHVREKNVYIVFSENR